MVAVKHLASPAAIPRLPACLSVLSYNVLLPNSQDGWWNYKMYLPPLSPPDEDISTWEYRKSLLIERIGLIDADVVCIQEVSPLSFEEDFKFMTENLGYDGVELFRKGRFRPATFWKKDRVELVCPAQHKDRTMLTTFRLNDSDEAGSQDNWHVLNCHLQAGKQGGRRVRQIFEGITTAYKAAKKLKEETPEDMKLIVCGDFNGGSECGAVELVEKGMVDQDFIEDGEQVSSKAKKLPLSAPLNDAIDMDREDDNPVPSTLVVPELISIMIDQGNIETAYMEPQFSQQVIDRLTRIYKRFSKDSPGMQMTKADVEEWLTLINGRVGRGTEFRNAAKYMGWKEPPTDPDEKKEERPPIVIPDDGVLTFSDFVAVYLDELRQGKFWGIAWDLAKLDEPLDVDEVFQARYDRMYCSASLQPMVVLDTISTQPCPNKFEPSDHLPVCAAFQVRK
mmetsp:Transcript_17213/g.25630  ORF Transcript_17213/g.25630 Transcript_17213/m.25630 type:complete len:450 (-) Transcript_17213:28-1377(-)